MGGAGRRRRLPVRPAWIRRPTWPKQRGAKLSRSSSSEGDGNPQPVVKPVRRDGVAVSKIALKVGVNGDSGMRLPKSASGGHDVGSKDIMEVGGDDDNDVNYSPMLGCCSCNEVQKHLVAEEGGCEGACPRNLGSCDQCGSPKHVERGPLKPKYVGLARLRHDAKGQLHVLDTEAEDSELEESCRPVLRRGAFGRRLAPTSEVALEAGSTKDTLVADDEMTEEEKEYMEQCLTGIEEGNKEVFIPWIKVVISSCYPLPSPK